MKEEIDFYGTFLNSKKINLENFWIYTAVSDFSTIPIIFFSLNKTLVP